MVQRVGQNRGGVQPKKSGGVMADTISPTGEDLEGGSPVEGPNGHDMIEYQRAVTADWVEGLMQRVNCALASNTPLTVCPRDLGAMNIVMLALSCVDVDEMLARVEQEKAARAEEEV